MIIGIAGGTASGKTTIAATFAARTGALLVAHDRYYRDGEPHTNFDHPDALETVLLVRHLDELRAGRPAAVPMYDYAAHRRVGEEAVEAREIIVVEGILVLADPELRARLDLRVYVEAPPDVRLLRRLVRDVRDRGRTMESVIDQYLSTVRPMHEAFVAPSREHAHLVLDGAAPGEEALARLQQALSQFAYSV